MALKAFIKDLSAVDEEQQALYKKSDNGFVLDVDPVDGFDLQNVTALKNSLHNLRGEYDVAKTTLKSFGELDPKDVMDKLARYEKNKDLNPERLKKELMIEARELVGNEYETKLANSNKTNASLKAAVKKSAMSEINGMIAQTGANPKFFQGHINDVVDVEFTDDGYDLVFKGPDGKPRFNIDDDAKTSPFTAKDLINELRNDDDYGQIFPTDANSGKGGPKKYATDKEGVKYISPADKGNYQEEIAAGTVEVKY